MYLFAYTLADDIAPQLARCGVFDSASFRSALRLSESLAAQVDEARRTRTLDVV